MVGDISERWVFPVENPSDPITIVHRENPYEMRYKVYDSLLPQRDYDELAARGVDGFKFLSRAQYDQALPDAPRGSICFMDVALASGLSAGKHPLPVQHPVGGAILRMRSKRICLVRLLEQGLEEIATVRVRGAHVHAISFAPHPVEPILYYGTNYGHLTAVPVTAETLGRQRQLVQFARLVSSIRVNSVGKRLYAGGLGQVMIIALRGGRYEILEDVQLACRSLELFDDRWLLVNQGIHGFRIYDVSGDRLHEEASERPAFAVDLLVASPDGSQLLAISKPLERMSFYQVQYGEGKEP